MSNVETDGHVLDRGTVSLQIGAFVMHRQFTYRLTATVDFSHVLGCNVVTGISKLLPIRELRNVNLSRVKGPYANYSLDHIADELWTEANRRMAIIQPLLQEDMFLAGAVETRAQECGVSRATVYRWLSLYTEGDQFLSLMPQTRGWKKGAARISDEIDRIIRNTINLVYMNTNRKSIVDVHRAVKNTCEKQGLKPPSIPTISARVHSIPRKDILRSRGYPDIAKDNFTPKPNKFLADYPLHRIQIDHTPGDVIIVDDEHRLPIGRPYVSLAIDMYSRVIVGYYVSLDAPSAFSVAMCLVHAMLPKDEWLKSFGIEAEWNVWGKPYEIHSDNGPDFKTRNLIQSCTAHNIDRQFRPKDTPHWGGQIESLMNTKARAFATLPGATARNVDERGAVDPDGEAVISFSAFEKWFVAQIIKYNNEPHSGIEFMPPRAKWNEAFLGSELRKPICGLPDRPADPLTLEIDFLPATTRTVQTYGVEWNAFYYAEILRPWIGHIDKKTNKLTKLVFRRDPRDINCIWFFEPLIKKYYRIPITTGPFPGVSVAAYKRAALQVKKFGLSLVDETTINQALKIQKDVIDEESATTRSARRQQQSEKNKSKVKTPAKTILNIQSGSQEDTLIAISAEDNSWGGDEVEIFGGII